MTTMWIGLNWNDIVFDFSWFILIACNMIGNFDNSKNQKNTIFDPYPIIHDNIRIWDFTSTQELPTCDFFVLDTQSVHFTKYQCPMTTTNLSHSLSFITFIILYYQSLSFIIIHYHSLSFIIIHYHSLSIIIIHYHSFSFILNHYQSLSFIIIHYHSLSFIIIHYHSLSIIINYYHSLSFIINHYQSLSFIIIHYHSLSFIIIHYHSLSCIIIIL